MPPLLRVVLASLAGLAALGASTQQAPLAGWLTYAAGSDRSGALAAGPSPASVQALWTLPLRGQAVAQPLIVANFPSGGDQTVIAATTAGSVLALTGNGYLLWQRDLGRLAHICPDLGGWGTVGTPVVDPARRLVYLVDGFGWLHGLALKDGSEAAGFPIRLYDDFRNELDWGGLTLAGDDLYVPTASYCDLPSMEGKVFRVSLGSRAVSSWTVVPHAQGGGGGAWGFGGLAYDAARDDLLALTGNALEDGANTGAAYSETTGYARRLIELSRGLAPLASSLPSGIGSIPDLDFSSSPVLAPRAGCGTLVLGLAKSGRLVAWREGQVAAGPVWSLELQPEDEQSPLIGQPVYSAALASVYVVTGPLTPDTGSALERVSIAADCSARIEWRRSLAGIGPGALTVNASSPTVAGRAVWVSASRPHSVLLAYDAESGARLRGLPLGAAGVTAPSVLGGELYIGALWQPALLSAFGGPGVSRAGHAFSRLPAHESRLGARLAWRSREDGVYSTTDAGRHWRRIYPFPADRVTLVRPGVGLISTGSRPPACNCRARVLWTADGGRHWHGTSRVDSLFAAAASGLYSSQGTVLTRIRPWPPRPGWAPATRVLARAAKGERIDALALRPQGVVALVNPSGNDLAGMPSLIVVKGATSSRVTLPRPDSSSALDADSLNVRWPSIQVAGRNPEDAGSVVWRSSDGGLSWTVAVSP
ncbi:MAG: hypothetical protein ACXVZW_04335 [Gaiellaceae bacterium]